LIIVKRVILFMLTGWIGTSLAGQNLLDQQGRKTGPWVDHYPGGNIRYEATFMEGRPVGLMVRYDDSGRVTARMMFDSTSNRCYTRLFHQGGKLAAEGWHVEQQKDSVWTYYSAYDGTVRMREDYQAGELHGKVYRYYPGGGVSEETNWTGNLREGEWMQFYENGNPRLRGHYIGNLLQGPYTVWYPDSIQMISGQYRMNRTEGTWSYFDESGKLMHSIEYKNGRPVDKEAYEKLMIETMDSLLIVNPETEQNPFQQ
jgi:antitoxin component YwqK of YwqJK toxin-antitoxin module